MCTRSHSCLDTSPLKLAYLQYAGKENEGLERGIDKGIMEFIGLIERDYVSEGAIYRPMDLARKAQYLTLDIIGDIAFGSDFGHLAQDADVHEYIKRTEASMPAMMIVSVLPVLARLMQSPILRRFMPSENDPHGFGKFIGYVEEENSPPGCTVLPVTCVVGGLLLTWPFVPEKQCRKARGRRAAWA